MVVEENINERIDKYLKNNTDFSRNEIVKMIEESIIKVNDKKISKSYKVKTGDKITIPEKYVKEIKLEKEDIPLDIVYEDSDIMVVNKPSGMVVHPGSGNKNHTLVNAILNYTNNLSNIDDEIRPGIVHRIDKDTSGLLVIAKTNKAHRILQDGFKNKTIKREYIALLKGEYPHKKAVINAPIGRSENRKTFKVTEKNSKNAITNLEVIKRYKGYTLVKLKLETGRTHQIRVHTKYIGYPVANDPVYGKASNEFGQLLHAASLEFDHPITGKHLSFTSELPKEFKEFLDTLE